MIYRVEMETGVTFQVWARVLLTLYQLAVLLKNPSMEHSTEQQRPSL
jgi:hypothetical protein